MRYVALLRGINVGGKTMVKMAELREWFTGLGFTNVVTYINSGNVGFDARKMSDKKLARTIETAIEKNLGYAVSVMIRTREEIADVLAHNPFEGKFESHKQMHVLFGREEILKDLEKKIMEFGSDDEEVAVRGRDIYALLRGSVAESEIGRGLLERKLKIQLTGRNWRTVQKLAEL
jgi:uncharacterized protein (DUF1697 family)